MQQLPERQASGATTIVAALSFLLAVGACGGGDLADPGPMSGKDRSQPFVGLPAADLDDLCDWTAGRFGGYGRRINCADGTYASSAASKSACVQSYQRATPQCTATVGDLEDCINGVVDVAPCTSLPAVCFELLFCAGGL